MKKIGFALCLLLTLAACTITKRQHLGGWHVEWKHRHQTANGTEVSERFVSDNRKADSPTEELQPKTDSLTPLAINESTVNPKILTEKLRSIKTESPHTRIHPTLQELNPVHSMFPQFQLKKLTKKLLSVKPNTEETSDLTGLAILLTIIGAAMIGIAVILLFLGLLATLSAANPYLAAAGVAFIAGLAMIIIGLVMGAKNAADRKDDIAREKEEKIKREKAKTQEEKDEAMWSQYKRAVRTSIIIAVLFFAISLFAFAVGEAIPIIPIMAVFFAICILLVWARYRQKIREAEGTTEGIKS